MTDWAITASSSTRGTTLHLVGDLDIVTAVELMRVADEVHVPGAVLTLDVRLVTFVDSRGLAALLHVHRTVQHRGGALVLLDPPARLRRLLAITQLEFQFDLQASPAFSERGDSS